MTREDAIKAIQAFMGWFKKDKPIYKALDMCGWRKEVKEHGCEFFDDGIAWIPCSERLPEAMDGTNGECSDDVLICVADDEQITISTGFYGYYPRSISQQGWWSMWAYGCHQLDRKYKVIAWMPLPTPYEPQESEE